MLWQTKLWLVIIGVKFLHTALINIFEFKSSVESWKYSLLMDKVLSPL